MIDSAGGVVLIMEVDFCTTISADEGSVTSGCEDMLDDGVDAVDDAVDDTVSTKNKIYIIYIKQNKKSLSSSISRTIKDRFSPSGQNRKKKNSLKECVSDCFFGDYCPLGV